MSKKTHRPPTIGKLRGALGEEGYALGLASLARCARRSRKRKEALRALVRLNTPPSDSDFIYFLGKQAQEVLHKPRKR